MQFSRTGEVWRIRGRGHVHREYGRVPKGYDPINRKGKTIPRTGKRSEARMTLKEIAAELGCSVQAVQQTEQRALAKLCAGLEGWL